MDSMALAVLTDAAMVPFDGGKLSSLVARGLKDVQEFRSADDWFELGRKAREAGRYGEALGHYRKALQVDPDHEGTLFWLGYCYLPYNCRLGTEDELYGLDQKTCSRRTVRCYVRLLWVRRRRGALSADDSPTLNNLAVAYGNLGERDKEEEALLEAIELNPADAVVRYNLGLTLRAQGKTCEAMEYFLKALEICPDDPGSLYSLARTEEDLGYKTDAIGHYRRYLDVVDRNDPWERAAVNAAVEAVDRLRNG